MRKHTKRKVWALVNPVKHAIEGAAITPKDALDRLRLSELSALEQYKLGAASIADWQTLASMVNLTQTLARMGIGPEALEAAQKAEDALIAGQQRHTARGKIGRASGEYEALRDCFEYHDLQRQSIGRAQYEAAIKKTADKIRSSSPDVRVLA